MASINQYCLSLMNESIAKDIWVQDLFNGAAVGTDPIIEKMRDLKYWDDFDNMSEERLAWYEDKLGINYGILQELPSFTLKKRRQIVKAWWSGWNKPTLTTVRNILDVFGITYTDIKYNAKRGTIYILLGEDTPNIIWQIAQDIIRRHVPAHIAISHTTPPASHYMSCAELTAANVTDVSSTLFTSFDGIAPLGTYYFKIEEEAKTDGD